MCDLCKQIPGLIVEYLVVIVGLVAFKHYYELWVSLSTMVCVQRPGKRCTALEHLPLGPGTLSLLRSVGDGKFAYSTKISIPKLILVGGVILWPAASGSIYILDDNIYLLLS